MSKLLFVLLLLLQFYRADPQRTGFYDVTPLRQTPEILWQHDLSDHGLVAPVLTEQTLFVGTHGGGQFFALNPEDGTIFWSLDELDEHVAAAAVHEDTAYFGSTGETFFAVDVESGEIEWSFEADGEIWMAAVLVNQKVYFGTTTGILYALDAGTGEELWNVALGANVGLIAYDQDMLIVPSGNTLYAVHPDTGETLWESEERGQWIYPAIADDRIYIGTRDGIFYAIDLENGETRWTFEGNTNFLAWSAPVVVNNIVYARNRGTSLYAFDAKSGDVLWETEISASVMSDPIIAQDVLYTGVGRSVHAFDTQTGEKLWELAVSGNILNAPVIGNETLFVVTDQGEILALR